MSERILTAGWAFVMFSSSAPVPRILAGFGRGRWNSEMTGADIIILGGGPVSTEFFVSRA
jgi:hypothetical protein